MTQPWLLLGATTLCVVLSVASGRLAAYRRGREAPFKGRAQQIVGWVLAALVLAGLVGWGWFLTDTVTMNITMSLVSLSLFGLSFAWQR